MTDTTSTEPMSIDPVLRLSELHLEPFARGSDYQSRDGGVAENLGLRQLGACYTEVEPGKSACPFHVHHVEDELFVILDGSGTYRFGDQEYSVQPGDVLGAPAGGPEFAHKLTNTGDRVLKYLAISSVADMDVCEYPDSGKFMTRSRRQSDSPFRYVGRASATLDYWDGEAGS